MGVGRGFVQGPQLYYYTFNEQKKVWFYSVFTSPTVASVLASWLIEGPALLHVGGWNYKKSACNCYVAHTKSYIPTFLTLMWLWYGSSSKIIASLTHTYNDEFKHHPPPQRKLFLLGHAGMVVYSPLIYYEINYWATVAYQKRRTTNIFRRRFFKRGRDVLQQWKWKLFNVCIQDMYMIANIERL